MLFQIRRSGVEHVRVAHAASRARNTEDLVTVATGSTGPQTAERACVGQHCVIDAFSGHAAGHEDMCDRLSTSEVCVDRCRALEAPLSHCAPNIYE